MSKAINLSGLKTLLEPLVHLINKKAECPDWDENDPSSSSYIANRTHYEETNFKEFLYTSILFDSNGVYEIYLPSFSLQEGNSYKVTWDGITYDCIARDDADGSFYIGNQEFAVILGGWVFPEVIESNEPFFISTNEGYGAAIFFGVEGNHTITLSGEDTIIHKIDEKYLPNLARVATSGSYNDLKDTPIIYTDVIRYDVSQNLSTSQKAQARVNIDAIEIDDLATVASSGDYNDLKNKLCSRVDGYSEWLTLYNVNSPETANPAGNTFVRWEGEVSLHPDKYPRAWKLYEDDEVYLTTEYRKGKTFPDYPQYFWGNASLYNPSWENTGEDWCIYARAINDDLSSYIIGCHIKGKNINWTTLATSYTQDDVWFPSDVYVGSTSGTNKDEGSKKLATEDFVSNAISAIPVPDVSGQIAEAMNELRQEILGGEW